MGQYYVTANISSREFITNDDFAKLMETAWIKNPQIGGQLVGLLLDEKSVDSLKQSQLNSVKPRLNSKNNVEVFPWGLWNGDIVVRTGDYDDEQTYILPEQIAAHRKQQEQERYSYEVYHQYEFENVDKSDMTAFRKHLLASENIMFKRSDYKISEILNKLKQNGLDESSPQFKHVMKNWQEFTANGINIYDLCHTSPEMENINYKQINKKIGTTGRRDNSFVFSKSITTSKLFLINYDKKQYLSLKTYLSQPGIAREGCWIIHPLPLLIARTTGGGGGDYYDGYPDHDYVGYWKNDHIGTSFFKPEDEDMQEILPFFSEDNKIVEAIGKFNTEENKPLACKDLLFNNLCEIAGLSDTKKKSFLKLSSNCIRPEFL